jgi:hypothetical protein
VLTWGLNSYGTFGNGTEFQDAHPAAAQLPAGVAATTLSMSYYTTLVTTSDSQLYTRGDNATFAKGALGTSAVSKSLTPIPVALPSGAVQTVDAGGPTSYVVLERS